MFLCYFLVYGCMLYLVRYLFIISTSVIDYLREFVSEMTCCVWSGMLNLTNYYNYYDPEHQVRSKAKWSCIALCHVVWKPCVTRESHSWHRLHTHGQNTASPGNVIAVRLTPASVWHQSPMSVSIWGQPLQTYKFPEPEPQSASRALLSQDRLCGTIFQLLYGDRRWHCILSSDNSRPICSTYDVPTNLRNIQHHPVLLWHFSSFWR